MRRERRTTEEWKAIIVAQQSSGVSAREYCAKHDIHLKTFSARKSDINKKTAQPNSKWVKVLKPQSQSVSPLTSLTLVYHGVILNAAPSVEAKWLADVMKALAS